MKNQENASYIPECLLHSNAYYVLVTDLEGNYLAANVLFEHSFLCTERLHPENAPVFSHVHTDDHCKYIQVLSACVKTVPKPLKVQLRKPASPASGEDKETWAEWEISMQPQSEHGAYMVHIGHDVTKIRVKRALLEQEEILRQITDNLSEVFWLSTADNQSLAYVNPAYELMTGRSCQSLYENPWSFTESVLEEDQARVMAQLADYALNRLFDCEYRIKHPDGSVRWVHSHQRPVYNKKGQIISHVGFSKDITERKLFEEKLHFQERFRQMLIEVATSYINLPLTEIDRAIHETLAELGAFVKADRVYIFDYNWVESTASNTYEWCAEGITSQIVHLQNLPMEESPFWANTHKEGQLICIPDTNLVEEEPLKELLLAQDIKSTLAIPMMDGADCLGFVGFDYVHNYYVSSGETEQLLHFFSQMIVNIRLRKKTGKELTRTTLLLNKAQHIARIGAWEIELKTNKTFWTDEVYAICEVAADFSHNRGKAIDFYHPDDRHLIENAILQAITRTEPFDVSCRFITAQGKQLWVRTAGYPMVKRGVLTHLIGVIQDITELQHRQETILAQNEALKAIAWQQSHEVRRPVAQILGLSKLLQTDHTASEQQKASYLEYLFRTTEELDQIIRRIVHDAYHGEYAPGRKEQ
jgi:PAS domain S-box-containing protein